MLDKRYKHDISLVVDRLVMRDDVRKRLADSIETAVALADGMVEIETVPPDDGAERRRRERWLYSEKFACPDHGPVIPELEPRIFSFNAPHGACERCTGLGSMMEIDPTLVVPDPSLSIAAGAIAPWANSSSNYYEQLVAALAERVPDRPRRAVEELDGRRARPVPLRHATATASRSRTRTATAAGAPTRRASRASSRTSTAATARPTPISSARRSRSTCRCVPCPACKGSRLRPESRAVLVGGIGDPRVHGDVGAAGAARGSTRSSCRRPIATSRA